MAKVSQLAAQLEPIVTALNDVGTQLDKAKTEIIAAVQASDPEVPTEVIAKIEQLGTIATALKAASQSLDDIVPDPTTPPTPA